MQNVANFIKREVLQNKFIIEINSFQQFNIHCQFETITAAHVKWTSVSTTTHISLYSDLKGFALKSNFKSFVIVKT